MYGRAFRNPSTYERFWEPNPLLEAERINTVEFTREQSFLQRWTFVGSVFHYVLGGLIEGVPISDEVLQYRNVSRARATGAEFELGGPAASWLEMHASFSAQRTRGISSHDLIRNSPARIVQFTASTPIPKAKLRLTGGIRYLSARLDARDMRMPDVTVVDLTLTRQRLTRGVDAQFGVRNLLNRGYSDPLSPEHIPYRLPAPGRNAFVKLTWRAEQ